MSRIILIVDDDPFIRKLVVTTLEGLGELREAGDGQEAVELAAALQPGLVLLDVDMPRLDGIEACRAIRAAHNGAGPTIVMLTAGGADEIEARAREAGADLFLTKPFSPLELLRLVAEMESAG